MVNTIKVLLADDHEVFRRSLVAFLNQQSGVQVVGEAADGSEAVEQAERLCPDVALLDLNMPHRNGFEAAKAIKRLRPTTKVFIVSTNDEEIYRKMAALNLADGYIKKSSLKNEILSLIDELLVARVSRSFAA